MSDTNCPHCGTPHWCCGTKLTRLSCRVPNKTIQSPLCREREAHNKTKSERDEAVEALMKIEDTFVDGDDVYEDRDTMGKIARETLEKYDTANTDSSTPETDELYKQLLAENAGNYIYLAEILPYAKKLELQRNEALEKVVNQAARIRYLEGATNHACGTPLTEARQKADKYKMLVQELAAAIRINTLRGTWRDANIETVETWLKPWLDKLE
jgi:hypothetical protein